ncbi:MAG: hypothetical protein IKE69_11700 [Thermoguttaceae bacterium]|nr:hypothetical protein [Thermoguttaceae bacterium]
MNKKQQTELLEEIRNGLIDNIYSELCYQLENFVPPGKYTREYLRSKLDWLEDGTNFTEARSWLDDECYFIAKDYEDEDVYSAMGLEIDPREQYVNDEDYENFIDWLNETDYTEEEYKYALDEYFGREGVPRDYASDLLYEIVCNYFFVERSIELKEAVIDKFLETKN